MPTSNIVQANFTPFWEGTSSAKPLCVQVSPVLKEGFPPQGTGSPVGVNELRWFASTEGGSPSLEVHGEPVRVIVKLESTSQKYTDSSNPKAVMNKATKVARVVFPRKVCSRSVPQA
ncbi:hypothetical protein V5G28_025120 [Scytonema sp. PRP1]